MFGISLLAVIILSGMVLRAKVELFRKFLLPASLIAGFLGLALSPQALNVIPARIVTEWSALPGRLISVVFACMFLGMELPSVSRIWRTSGPQVCYGFIAGIGQYFVGIALTLLILTPVFGVPSIFATLIEIGFSGGPGTASGMMEVFSSLGFPQGADLGLMSSTVGIFTGVVFGMIMINIAIRRSYTVIIKDVGSVTQSSPATDRFTCGKPIGYTFTGFNSIDPLTFHLGFVGISILIGWLLYTGIRKTHPIMQSFPLFPMAMIGGILVQLLATKLKIHRYIDRGCIERIQGAALDLLVASAIASLNIQVIIAFAAPFAVLMCGGIIWMLVLTWFLAPRMLPDAWFERSIVEFGMQTGVTAIGLMLLRVVDPEFKTGAATSFGFKQMIYEPLLGGGLITSIAPFVILQFGAVKSLLITAVIMIVFAMMAGFSGFFHMHPEKHAPQSSLQHRG